MEGCDFRWKIPSRNIIKKNECGSATSSLTCIRNNNRFSILEDFNEDKKEKDHQCVNADKQSDEKKI